VVCLATSRLTRSLDAHRASAAGFLAGVLALLNPATIFVTGPWLLYILHRHSGAWQWRFTGLAMLVAALTIAPWVWRNYRQFHLLVPIRDNFGLELYLANNDLAGPSFITNEASHRLKHPGYSAEEADALRAMGEARYSRSRFSLAMDWIRRHPSRFLALTIARTRMFWLGESRDPAQHAWAIAWMTLASVAGLLLLARRREPAVFFMVSVSLVYPPLYYVVQTDPRYRVPILWLTLLGAGYLMSAVWNGVAHWTRSWNLGAPDVGRAADQGTGGA